MSLQARLTALATAIGTDIKALNTKYNAATVTLDTWKQIGAAGQPAFQNNWVSYDSTVWYRKDPFGRVHLRGSMNSGTHGAPAFTLPVGYRPSASGLNRVRAISIGNQTAVGQWEAQVNINIDGTVVPYFTGSSATSYVSLDGISFDSGTITELSLLTAGTIPTTLTLDTPHIVGAAGQPAFGTNWTSYDGGVAYQVPGFKKDPFGKVTIFGSAKGGASASVIFTLPEGYRPTKAVRFNPRGSGQGNTPWAQINIATNGQVTVYGDATTALVSLDGIEFDTDSVTQIIIAGQVQAQPEVVTTLNWNLATTPGFYRSTNDGALDTINGPGDTLNPPAQAGIVTVHANGALVQRVWDLDIQKAWVRYRNQSNEWTAWIPDLTKVRLDTELMIGGPTPLDGEERYFQTAAMKALGIMWKFRYNSGGGTYKWEFVGGAPWRVTAGDGVSYTTGNGAYVWGPALATPKITSPLSGNFSLSYHMSGQSTYNVADVRSAAFGNGGAVPQSESFAAFSSTMYSGNFSAETILTALEGQVIDLRLQAMIANLAITIYSRSVSIVPIRVAL